MKKLEFRYNTHKLYGESREVEPGLREAFEAHVMQQIGSKIPFITGNGGYIKATSWNKQGKCFGELIGGAIIKEAIENGDIIGKFEVICSNL